MFLAKGVQPIQELLGLVVAGAGNDLAQAVDEDMGDVIIASVQTADKALQGGIAVDILAAGLHQTDLIVDVISQLGAPLDADDIAVLGLDGVVDHVDHLLGLAGALLTHDYSNHVTHSLRC